jgi:hypothetical protein
MNEPIVARPNNRPQLAHDNLLSPDTKRAHREPTTPDAKAPATVTPLYFSHGRPARDKKDDAATVVIETCHPTSKTTGTVASPVGKPQTSR